MLMKTNDLIDLKNHEYYFDNIIGKKWDEFKKSIVELGIRTPIIITKDKHIISGHQRVRACRELGIDTIESIVYDDIIDYETMLLLFIELNLKQRGNNNTNPIKLGRCIIVLEKLYGIRHGGNRYAIKDNGKLLPTQEDIAKYLNMSARNMNNYKRLCQNLIPQIQSLIIDEVIKPTTALKYLVPISKENQLLIYSKLDKDHKTFTDNEIRTIRDEVAGDNGLKEAIKEILNVCKKYENIYEIQRLLHYINKLM